MENQKGMKNMITYGIIGAMPSELSEIAAAFPDALKETSAMYEFHVAEKNGKKIVFVCCGIGKVNSAVCTQVLIDRYNPDFIINTGVAGGMGKEVKVCDIVIASDARHHDLVPRLLENYPPFCSDFKSDEHLVELAKKACGELGYACHTGRIVSGEQFISDSSVKANIIKEFDPLAVDMETSGIAHTAFRNGVAFVSVRCMSDSADDNGEMSFEEFEKIAADKNARVIMKMIG